MLNLHQTQLVVKAAQTTIIPNPNHPLSQGLAYRELKAAGFTCHSETDRNGQEIHEVERVPIFRRGPASIRRNKSARSHWIIEIDGQTFETSESVAEISEAIKAKLAAMKAATGKLLQSESPALDQRRKVQMDHLKRTDPKAHAAAELALSKLGPDLTSDLADQVIALATKAALARRTTKPALSPARLAALDLTSEYPALADRIERALALAEAGQLQFPKYKTAWDNAGLFGNCTCECPDALHRAPRTKFGAGCKHSLALEIARRVAGESKSVAYRKLADNVTHRAERERALPADAGAGRSILDMLGYDDPATNPQRETAAEMIRRIEAENKARFAATQASYDMALRPDPLNRQGRALPAGYKAMVGGGR